MEPSSIAQHRKFFHRLALTRQRRPIRKYALTSESPFVAGDEMTRRTGETRVC
jgi:hypothetical protein